MKASLLSFALTSIILISNSAFAGNTQINCRDLSGGADHGYIVNISKSRKAALVQIVTIAGSKAVAKLVCQSVKTKGPTHPDQLLTVLTCSEPELRDAGYTLIVQTGGFAGLTVAKLSSVTLVGETPLTQLACQ